MAAPFQNSAEALGAEILAEARRESDEILRRAKREEEKLLAIASTEADKIRLERRDQANAEAARRKELVLATVAVEAGRMRSARVESLLESIRQEVQDRLLARDFEAIETVVGLAAEALRGMTGNDFVLKISAADHSAFSERLAEAITSRVGRLPLHLVISANPAARDGVIVQSADGFQVWDNQLSSRLERLWPELRRQIATRASLVGDKSPNGGVA